MGKSAVLLKTHWELGGNSMGTTNPNTFLHRIFNIK
jgi:hypothetical protein